MSKILEQKTAEDLGVAIARLSLAARCMSDSHPDLSKELEAISKRVEQAARQYTKDTKPYEIL